MSAFVDTNILVRHLTGDPPDIAARATAYLASEDELLLTDLVAAETVYVLESFYEAPRHQVAEAVRSLIAFDSVVCVDPALLLRAAEVYETDLIDFADAYLVACAESTDVGRIASFDRSLDRVRSIERIERPRFELLAVTSSRRSGTYGPTTVGAGRHDGRMAEQFEFQDLSDAVFWGVDLQRATFRDVDLTGVRISHARLADVVIDAEIDRLVINGVDVTAYVNERDDWFALRSQLHPTVPENMREGWEAFLTAWGSAIERARSLPEDRRHASVDGEWSFVETLRHLVFATDKWFTVPILGGAFHPMGLPNSGSADFGWPGIDDFADPTFEDAAAAWQDRGGQLRDHFEDIEPAALKVEVAVLENGASAVHDCIGVVFEEHFQHLRYATRDLDRLG